ncbi:hypothetical protein M758_UG326700 [Ceratodon purpureus]|nr:hypothetical protein M758_UG326700 [Ceratodon purpureus]KAG0597305.1 hypothetical protein M758_UG326700 [Ceratodon purpureus]
MDDRPEAQVHNAPFRPTAMLVNGSFPVGNSGASRGNGRGSSSQAFTRTAPTWPTVVSTAIPVPAVTRPSMQTSGVSGPSQAKRARKDRGPNWLPTEVFALISVKCDMYLEELDTIDGRDLMTRDSSKWNQVAQAIMRLRISPCMRDGAACKTKWYQLIPDYKKIADYLNRSGRNLADYYEMSSSEWKGEGLPRLFAHDVYTAINEWYGSRPQIQPPHVRDLLANNDSNYNPRQPDRDDDIEDAHSKHETDDQLTVSSQRPLTLQRSLPQLHRRRGVPPRSLGIQPNRMLQEDHCLAPQQDCHRGLPPHYKQFRSFHL